ncbi:hypothetical protein ASG31_16985 [Chryseobacterium sp. Leaf404]|nr:hypothetical protein ASG31_16985 [Chryseobacterium sp. Leaf404]
MRDINSDFFQIAQILNHLGLKQNLKNLAVLFKSNLEQYEVLSFRPDHFSILIIKKGQLDVKVNSTDYKLTKNNIFIIPPGKNLELNVRKDVQYYAVLFTEKYINNSVFFQKHFKLYPFFNHEILSSFKLKGDEVLFMISLLRPLQAKLAENSNIKEDQNICELLFQIFIMQLMAYFNMDDQHLSINKNDLIYRFLNLVSINYKQRRDVKFYSEKLSVNPKYLSQLLSMKTGKSAKEYIDDAVIMEAKMLLDNPQNSVRSVADELCFSDQFHFSQFFKRKTRKTPTQHRLESDL